MIDRGIILMALAGIVIGAWTLFGWGLGVGALALIAILAHERRTMHAQVERERRQRIREAAWTMGDRRLDR